MFPRFEIGRPPLNDPLSETDFKNWADWALSQADRIDPVLSGSFRTVQLDDCGRASSG